MNPPRLRQDQLANRLRLIISSDVSEGLIAVAQIPDLELLTTSEAAVVAGVEVRDVNRLIDENILPAELYSVENTRRVRAGACALVRFYYGSAELLTANERRGAITHLCTEAKSKHHSWAIKRWRTAKPNWTYHHLFMTLNFDKFIEETIEGHERLEKAREIVVEDPGILSGTPVIKGTRVPVYDVAASAASGLSVAEIRKDYPSLSEDKIELAILYAKSTPPRGRPKAAAAPGKRRMISRRVYSRRAV
jgi:uncharacterized protein (DUF433 family)